MELTSKNISTVAVDTDSHGSQSTPLRVFRQPTLYKVLQAALITNRSAANISIN